MRMVRLCLKLFVRRNEDEDEDWAASSVVLYYDAATLQELCEQIRDALFQQQDGCIAHNYGVKVDSFFGLGRWHTVSRFEDIPPDAMLRIVLRDGAAEPTGSGQKRNFDAVAGGAEETGPKPKIASAKFAQDDGAAEPTGKRLKCEHGRQWHKCKDCGGTSICTHGRERSACRDCRESAVCPHGRRKYDCRDCGGGSVCPHGRRKYDCRDCGGGSVCPHGRQRSKCKDCGGGSICTHGKRRTRCKECGGGSVCEHGRRKDGCSECEAAKRDRISKQNKKQKASQGRA